MDMKTNIPFLALTISGGHTQILKLIIFDMTIIAKPQMMLLATLTKCKILGLPYPGGPLIDKYAQLGNPKAFALQNQKFQD
jgi:N6-L-threonylcarbamoyladenine synthase